MEYRVGNSSTRTARPEYGRQRKMPARNRRYAASSTSTVMSGRAGVICPASRVCARSMHGMIPMRRGSRASSLHPWPATVRQRTAPGERRTHDRPPRRGNPARRLLAQEPLTTAGRIGETVPAEVAACFEDARRQRADGVPVAYLLGRREFWSLEFAVNPAVLVPRPETELLVQRVLDLVPRARSGRGRSRHRFRRDRHRARP